MSWPTVGIPFSVLKTNCTFNSMDNVVAYCSYTVFLSLRRIVRLTRWAMSWPTVAIPFSVLKTNCKFAPLSNVLAY